MSSDYYIEADRFAATMEKLLGEIPDELDPRLGDAVKTASREGRKLVRKNARSVGPHKGLKITGKYISGWSYKVKKTPEGWSAEIGNKNKPGLAHLLEKGHAKVGGGRVPGYEHIAPAANDTFRVLQEKVNEAVNSL